MATREDFVSWIEDQLMNLAGSVNDNCGSPAEVELYIEIANSYFAQCMRGFWQCREKVDAEEQAEEDEILAQLRGEK